MINKINSFRMIMRENIKVSIITEAGIKYGFGHLVRCSSLYHAFTEKKIYPRFIIHGDDTIEKFIDPIKYKSFDWVDDPDQLFHQIKDQDIVIIDSYEANYQIYEKISEFIRIPVFIDDNLRINYPSGILINTSLKMGAFKELNSKNLTPLLGPKYCMLKRELWEPPTRELSEKIKTAMLTFGGSDDKNITPKLLKELRESFPKLKKKVIIGPGYNNIAEIEDNIDNNTELIYFPTTKDMIKIMSESDVSITAGGQTIYELASMGVPAITIADAENQLNNVNFSNELGINFYAGWWQDEDLFNKIRSFLIKLMDINIRREMIRLSTIHVRPDGSRTITNILLKLLSEKN